MIQDLYNEGYEAGVAAERAEWQKPVPLSEWQQMQATIERLTKIEAAAREFFVALNRSDEPEQDIAYKKLEEALK